MVAHGTIAFDTLTTSDQVETGTEKSIDTSYLYHGTPKAWGYSGQVYSAGTPVDDASLNISSNTDSTTGDVNHNYSSIVSSLKTGAVASNSTTSSAHDVYASADTSTSYVRTITRNTSDNLTDNNRTVAVYGELA